MTELNNRPVDAEYILYPANRGWLSARLSQKTLAEVVDGLITLDRVRPAVQGQRIHFQKPNAAAIAF